jgi:hypothetical protein
MTDRTRECAATPRSCGTPGGWRQGGRCTRCRRAHNLETREARGLTREQRAAVLRALRAGVTAQEAAEAVGKSVRSLQSASGRDGELRAAMDGESLVQQEMARRADLLCAMVRNGGNREEAARELGEKPTTVASWVRNDPLFATVETAVVEWVVAATGKRSRKSSVTQAQLDKAVEMLEGGAPVAAVLRVVGVARETLRKYAKDNPRLAAAWPAGGEGRPKTQGMGEQARADLREMWKNPSLTTAMMAERLGIKPNMVSYWAKRMELPDRRRKWEDWHAEPARG